MRMGLRTCTEYSPSVEPHPNHVGLVKFDYFLSSRWDRKTWHMSLLLVARWIGRFLNCFWKCIVCVWEIISAWGINAMLTCLSLLYWIFAYCECFPLNIDIRRIKFMVVILNWIESLGDFGDYAASLIFMMWHDIDMALTVALNLQVATCHIHILNYQWNKHPAHSFDYANASSANEKMNRSLSIINI